MTRDVASEPELALGTANWGGTYGAPGREVQVHEKTARAIAAAFLGAGHTLVDTAPAYGGAEEMVGSVFEGAARVVTKIPSGVLDDPSAHRRAVDSLRRSLSRTRVERFAGVLLHDPTAATRGDGRAKDVLAAVRDADLAARVGVSVYAPEEAYAAVEALGADLVQVPCNALDQRFLASGCMRDMVDASVEVHVRSVFLNGVILVDPAQLDGPLAPLAPAMARLRKTADAMGMSVLELALEFARRATGAHAVVVGAYTEAQLSEVLSSWAADTVPDRVAEADWTDLAAKGVSAVDPRTWASDPGR